jgi:general secretion pathway protein N
MASAKRRRWPWVLLFVLLLVGIGIATLPAQVAWRFLLSGQLQQVQLDGLTGTVWRGTASELRVRGVSLGALGWQLDAMSLLRGAPVLDVRLNGPLVDARAQLQRYSNAALELRDLNAQFDAQWLGPLLALPALQPQGRVQLSVPQLKVDADGVPASGQLQLNWTGAAFSGMAQAPIGDVQVQAQGDARRWLGTVGAAADGPLLIEGGFSLVERAFNADIRLAARDPNHPAARILPMIGQTQADGSQRYLIQGVLLPLAAP